MKFKLLAVLAGGLFALQAQAQDRIFLSVQDTLGNAAPCSASLLHRSFGAQVQIINGSPPGDSSAFIIWDNGVDNTDGSSWSISASPASGWEFVEWRVQFYEQQFYSGDIFSPPPWTLASLSFTSPNARGNVRVNSQSRLVAVFRLLPPVQYTLTVSHDGNASATSPAVGNHLYNPGTRVNLSAAPATGYMFLRWEDPAVPGLPHPNVDIDNSYTPPRYSILMDSNHAVRAVFAEILTITANNPAGPATAPITTFHAAGQLPTVSVPNPIVMAPGRLNERFQNTGWSAGGPQIPATGGAGSYTFTSPIAVNNALTWEWQRQFRVLANVSGDGMIPQLALTPAENWFAAGTEITLDAIPAPGSVFFEWTLPAGVTILSGTIKTTQITLLVNRAIEVIIAQFRPVSEDTDGDGLPDAWEIAYGLDPFDATGHNGRNGDPDNDGLTNFQEFMLVYSNATVYLSADPLNADTDGDGMIDGWEYRMFLSEALANPNVIPAPLDPGTYSPNNRYGRYGNPDGDYLWDTETGWQTLLPLYNWLEYVGPDGEEPYLIVEVTSESLGLPPGRIVRRAIPNPADTGDGSHPLNIDSDNDLFDDGFEYSWDQWQQANEATPMTSSPLWPGITEDVQTMVGAWGPGNRPFNPAVPHNTWNSPTAYGNSRNLNLGYWYNTTFGVIDADRPMTNLDAYFASDLTLTTPYPVVRPARGGTTTRWCTNPFVWDSDGDGMPDGWELSFGFDPWAARSLNAGTPANRTDATFTADGEGFAYAAPLRHRGVYLAFGFNPFTGYAHLTGARFRANTAEYSNYQELIGVTIDTMDELDTLTLLNQTDWLSTHPLKVDSDGDGMYDGWEAYAGLDPLDAGDRNEDADYDDDGLTNFEEFDSAATSPDMLDPNYRVVGWYNKVLPTDPWDLDTDGDQLMDGTERELFNNGGAQFAGGGLNPTSVDTDGDFLPDGWEAYFGGSRWSAANPGAAPVDGTVADAFEDPDGDGLLNYQEYMTGAVYHWQFQHVDQNGFRITVLEPSVKPMELYAYDPYDFFNPAVYGRQPYEWDPSYLAISSPPAVRPVPFTYIAGYNAGYYFRIPQYSSTDPGNRDSDMDMMDDFWEVYHGLNPVYGLNDLVRRKFAIGGTPDAILFINNLLDEYNIMSVPQPPDLRRYPWMAGDPLQDPDQDQILSIDEAVLVEGAMPPALHTDPSPLWMTDISSPHSWVNQFYWLGNTMGSTFPGYWFWDDGTLLNPIQYPPPTYMFSFEMNDGFDTDNDGISDGAEIVHSATIAPGVSDPLDSMSPPRRRALYLDGIDSAARTATGYSHMFDDLQRFTVEAWVRPSNPARGTQQIIVERAGIIPQGNPELPAGALLVNFRLGIDPTGAPFVAYNGKTMPYLFNEAKAGTAFRLTTDEWVHIAGTFDGPEDLDSAQQNGLWTGTLRLFINGQLAASTQSSVIPVNGFLSGLGRDPNDPDSDVLLTTGTIVPMSINVGATDLNSGATIYRTPFDPLLVGPPLQSFRPGAPTPVMADHFHGWVDEIRIWNRGRTAHQIGSIMTAHFTRTQVTQLEDEQALRYYYTFNNLPDPNKLTAPVGFASVSGRPIGYFTSPWWGESPVRSVWYDDYRWIPWIENLVAHRPLTVPLDTTLPASEVLPDGSIHKRYHNSSNPYTMWYRTGTRMEFEDHPFLGNDDESEWNAEGMWGELPIAPDLLPLGYARTDEQVDFWDNGLPADELDSDGDGLPDWWEILYGLDPFDPTGDNGAYGDPDGDGLTNIAEYYAGTNPMAYDTYGTGYSDYFGRDTPQSLTYGELYDDMDGMPALWEIQYGLDPDRYDAHEDPDGDGWTNYQEYMAGTDPTSPLSVPRPALIMSVLYDGMNEFGNFIAETYTDLEMDGRPDAQFIQDIQPAMNIVDEYLGTFKRGVTRYSGRLNVFPIVPGSILLTIDRKPSSVFVEQFTDPIDPVTGAYPGLLVAPLGSTGTINYDTGEWTVELAAFLADEPMVVGAPLRADYTSNFQSSPYPLKLSRDLPAVRHVRGGLNRMFAYLDLDGNGTYSTGEPAGMAVYQPLNIDIGDLKVTLPLRDSLYGFPRFSWPAQPGAEKYYVSIRQGAAVVAVVTNDAPRSFVMEQDFLSAGGLNLGASNTAGFTWEARTSAAGAVFATGGFTNDVAALKPRAPVSILNPEALTTLNKASFELRWKMDDRTQGARIVIKNANNQTVFDKYCYLPVRHGPISDPNHYYTIRPLELGGRFVDLPDGTYTITVTEHIRSTFVTKSSASRTFLLDRKANPSTSFSISGSVAYFGKVPSESYMISVAAPYNGVEVRKTGTLPQLPHPGALTLRVIHNGNTLHRGSDVGATGVEPTHGLFSELGGKVGEITYSTGAFVFEVTTPPPAGAELRAYYKHYGSPILIQAFLLAGDGSLGAFNGVPAAQQTVYQKGAFMLNGLPAGKYALRAFLDQNGNGILDPWESRGYVMATELGNVGQRHAKTLTVPPSVIKQTMILYDQDTDNDGLPDSWEYFHFGSLTARSGLTQIQPGLYLWQEYADGELDSDPNEIDTDGDGLPDNMELLVTFTDTKKRDTDGDGLSDLEEFLSGSDPLDPNEAIPYKTPTPVIEDGHVVVTWPHPRLIEGTRLTFLLKRKHGLDDTAWETMGSVDVEAPKGSGAVGIPAGTAELRVPVEGRQTGFFKLDVKVTHTMVLTPPMDDNP